MASGPVAPFDSRVGRRFDARETTPRECWENATQAVGVSPISVFRPPRLLITRGALSVMQSSMICKSAHTHRGRVRPVPGRGRGVHVNLCPLLWRS